MITNLPVPSDGLAYVLNVTVVGAFSVIVQLCRLIVNSTIGDKVTTSSYKILKYLRPPDMREPAIIAGCCIIQNVIIGAIIHLCCCSLGEFVVPSV